MDSGLRAARVWTGFSQVADGSLIDRLTAAAQAARDAFEYSTVKVDGKRYRMREDFEDVMRRHAQRYGNEETKWPTPPTSATSAR